MVDQQMAEIIDHNVHHQLKSGLDARIKRCFQDSINDDTGVIAIALDNISSPVLSRLDTLESAQVELVATLEDARNFIDRLQQDVTTLM